MKETRNVKITVMVTQELANWLNAYAVRHNWSQSTAAALLIRQALAVNGQDVARELRES
jgi:hypothetical protein